MYHKDDLIVGFNLLDCQIIKIEGNEYTLECVHCHKLYKYEPNNCRWTDMKTQANNKTNNKYLEYQGRVQTLSQWCEELGLDYYRTKARLNTCGMTVEQAFNKNYYKNDGSKKLNKNIVYKLKGE